MILLHLAACSGGPGPADGDQARRWAQRHETTLRALSARGDELLAALPSLPGDRFFCRETVAPPGLSEVAQEALRQDLCRQQESAWNAERHEAEEELGVKVLNGAFQRYGVVGVALSVAGPDGVEWSDHRGVWALEGDGAVPVDADGAVPWGEDGSQQLGWGQVALGTEQAPLPAVWALEWRGVADRRSATATLRAIVLADGTPDAAFVRRALGTEDEPPPVRIPVQIP